MRVYREWPLLILVYLLLSSAIFSSADDWPIPLLDSSNAWTCCNNSVPDKGADMLSGGCWDRTTDCLFASLIWQEIFYINNIYFARIISPELNSQLPPWLRRTDRERGGKGGGGLGGKVVKGGVGEVEPKKLFSWDYCLLTSTPLTPRFLAVLLLWNLTSSYSTSLAG